MRAFGSYSNESPFGCPGANFLFHCPTPIYEHCNGNNLISAPHFTDFNVLVTRSVN